MSNLTRKDFLKLSSWGLVATLLPVGKINAISSILKHNTPLANSDYDTAVQLASQAKVLFYQKKFNEAEGLYLQCINLAPGSIRFYDNLDNVYGAKSDILSSVLLFKNGLELNPSVIAFYHRAAHSLMRMETGNKKIAMSYSNQIHSTSLLLDAKALLLRAITIDPTKNYLAISLAKVEKKIILSRITDRDVLNSTNREDRRTNRQQFRNSFSSKTESEIQALIRKVDSKKRVTLYHVKDIAHQQKQVTKQKKRYSRILLSLKDSEKDRSDLLNDIYNMDPSDPVSMVALKKDYYKNNRYVDFIEQRKKFADIRQDFFANLGLMDTIEKAYLKENVSRLEEAEDIGKDMYDNWPLPMAGRVDVANKLTKIYLLQNRAEDAEHLLAQTIQFTTTNSAPVINKLIFSLASVAFFVENYEKTKFILLAGLNEEEEPGSIDFDDVRTMAKSKEDESFDDKKILYYLLYRAYEKLGDGRAHNILERLYLNNPEDKFVLTRR